MFSKYHILCHLQVFLFFILFANIHNLFNFWVHFLFCVSNPLLPLTTFICYFYLFFSAFHYLFLSFFFFLYLALSYFLSLSCSHYLLISMNSLSFTVFLFQSMFFLDFLFLSVSFYFYLFLCLQGRMQRFSKTGGALCRPPWLADEENFRF